MTAMRIEAAWLREKPLSDILAVLDRDGEEARVVGGAVRNALLGIAHGDIDIATTALPHEVKRRAEAAGFKVVPTGIEHGTVTIVADGRPFEVTTLREDVETFGRHATVRFGRDWMRDAERRDFTMNGLSASADGTVHDYVGGLADIETRQVRFIGDAATRIAEDYLRILRFFRFHAYYGAGHPDAAGLHAAIIARDGLAQLSRERVRMELMKLMLAPRATAALANMAQSGLLGPAIGGVAYLASFENMTKAEAATQLPPDATRRLGALGVWIVEDAERMWQRLRLSNAEHQTLAAMADDWRRVEPQMGEQAARVLIYQIGPEHFTACALLAWSRSQASAHDEAWRDLVTLPQRWSAPVFPLRAADFMARGVEKGPSLGAALARAEAAWATQGFPMDRKALNGILNEALGG
jgi:poly(A) polymerase